MATKEKFKMNKFYVGASHIADAIAINRNDVWTKPTLVSAIAHGRELMEEEERDIVVIVEIKYVLRRERTPIKVEKV